MLDSWRQLWRISRPRRWFLLFGPYLLGAIIGAGEPIDLFAPLLLVFALFFLWPANLLIYGLADFFDTYNDQSKQELDVSHETKAQQTMLRLLMMTALPFLLFLPLAPGAASLAMWAFLFLALEYSAPPIRAKDRPPFDALFSAQYLFPGVFGYFLAGGDQPSLSIIVAAYLWIVASYAYCAAQRLSADYAVRENNIATLIGRPASLGLSLALYASAAVLALPSLTWLAATLGVLYASLMFFSLIARTEAMRHAIAGWMPFVQILTAIALLLYILDIKWI